MIQTPNSVISTILKHDTKQTSYKIALLRAINDIVLSFPDIRGHERDVAIPLRLLAEFWLAYYWPFVDPDRPIMQGARAKRGDQTRSDMAFRPALTNFRVLWQDHWGGITNPADGFFVIQELRVPRTRAQYPPTLVNAYEQTLQEIARTIEQPIHYAGPGEWSVFDRPLSFDELQPDVIGIPGTRLQDRCLVVKAELWQAFHTLSLWVEALCIHEWCLFTERVEQPDGRKIERGSIYTLLTARPDNRRPLNWERNQVDLLLMEGKSFVCPWSERSITQPRQYDLDHLVPVSIYPINELWNLIPANPTANLQKRDRLPTGERLERAIPHLVHAYHNYELSPGLTKALHEDVAVRFTMVRQDRFPVAVAEAVADLITAMAEARNIARY